MQLSPERRFRCEILSWEAVARDAKRLSHAIRQSGYMPDIIVAVTRGGLIPARIVSDYLHIKDIATIKVEHWGIAATPDEKAILKFPLNADIKNKKVLLVDDITDTGDTLEISVPYLRGFDPEEIRTATLLHKTTSHIIPEYFVRKISRWRWIIFPWHVWEDLTLFIKETLAGHTIGIAAVRRELKERFRLDVSAATIREIISEIGTERVSVKANTFQGKTL
jgi:uncharacterized protein